LLSFSEIHSPLLPFTTFTFIGIGGLAALFFENVVVSDGTTLFDNSLKI